MQIIFNKLLNSLTGLPAEKLINVFTDGPNIMKSLKKKINETFPNVLDIGTCNLHVIHNVFAKGIENFGIDVEDLLVELHYFFKRSAVHSEELRELQVKLGLPEHVLIRHVDSRWLTLHLSVQQFIEQFNVLKAFFYSRKDVRTVEASRLKKYVKNFPLKLCLQKPYLLGMFPIFL